MRNHGNTMLSFGDIMSILLVCMVLVCILLSAKIAQEQFTDIILETQQQRPNASETPGPADLFLTVTREGTFVFESLGNNAQQTASTHAQAVEAIKTMMPAKVFLRADRHVDFGTVHRFFNATTEIGIPVALAAKLP